jgi:toxin-antitoxin system PIN domain toxin
MKKDSKPVLLDVNVLIALGWSSHAFHSLVTERMERQNGPWFTCTITQLGFMRLSANPAVTKAAVSPGLAADLLARLTRDRHHQFLPELVPAAASATLAGFRRAVGPQQVTDAFLLALAGHSGASFLTLDARLTNLAVGLADLEILRAN